MDTTPKTEYSFKTIQEFNMANYTDYTIRLEDVENDKYKIVIKLGDNISSDVVQKRYVFDLELPKSCKVLGLMNIKDDTSYTRVLETLQSAYNEDEIGMKIDTTLDKEPLYFCDGDKKKLIITEPMIVRGDTNFNDNQLKYEGKNILCDDNLV